jgi:hypothetical protein
LIHARDDLLGYGGGIDMIWIKAIAKPRHTGRDLVELYALFAPIWNMILLIIQNENRRAKGRPRMRGKNVSFLRLLMIKRKERVAPTSLIDKHLRFREGDLGLSTTIITQK